MSYYPADTEERIVDRGSKEFSRYLDYLRRLKEKIEHMRVLTYGVSVGVAD